MEFLELIMWLQGKYIFTWYVSGNMLYMYLLQSITRYIYIYATKTSGENSMWAMKKPLVV